MLNTKTTKIKMSTGEKIFSVINYRQSKKRNNFFLNK